ncbi:kelch-like protein 32 [Nematolebias whitei]|uniref:kelch-like protein 32 n=1 Tax=Nematolebias whitei TaxID=451745 RepID=UPI0018990452|nr:kelch-like protein 32 [Nematolebias whitei]
MPSEASVSSKEMLTGQRLCHSKSHQDSVLSALNQQRKDGQLCDVTLVAGEQKFHAHKAVLAACSDYFRAMFSLCMVESEADEVTLQGVTSVGLKHALDFAYTGQILLEPAVIQDVLSAGSHLQLLELLSLCSHYLIQELSSVNYLELYRVADLFHLPALEEAVVGFLVEHLSELSQSRQDEAQQLPYRLLREVLKSDRLTSLSEEEIWKLVVLWLEHDCRYQYTEDLLQHVRYGLMDVPTLHHLAHSHPLVQSSPIAAALVDEALDYHHATFAQPLHQSAITGPRFQSLTLYIIGGRKREVSRVRELRYFNPSAQEHVRVAGGSNWSELAAMPTGRSHHCVAVMGNFLFVVGSLGGGRLHNFHNFYNICTVTDSFLFSSGQNESGVAVHDDRIYVVGGYSIWTNEPLACIQVLDLSAEGKEEVFYGPTLPFASNGIATCFLPAPHFTCPNLQTLQVPHHRMGAV